MPQTPPLSAAVRAEVDRQYPGAEADAVAQHLARYGDETHHREPERVRLAVLTLADGDAAKIGWLVDAACQDYRDVLYWLTFDADGNPPPLPSGSGPQTRKTVEPPPIPADLLPARLVLTVAEPPNYDPHERATDPSRTDVFETVKSLPWREITFVVVAYDERYWLEGSGSPDPGDGFSGSCQLGDQLFVTKTAPASLDAVAELLASFAGRDDSWRTLTSWVLVSDASGSEGSA